MHTGIHIFCFALCYAIALALEVSRLLFRSSIRGVALLAASGAGLIAHTVFLYEQAVTAHGSPLSSYRDWLLLVAWILVMVYLYLTYYHPKTSFGIFLLPMVLVLIVAAEFLADSRPFAEEPASMVWGIIHGTSLVAATVSVFVGFAAGLMYLGHARRLKHKRPPLTRLQLPSLEWLQIVNSRAMVIALLTLGVGVASGFVLNAINRHSDRALSLSDPLVLGTLALLLLLIVSAFYRPVREGRKVAYLTVASFVLLVFALLLGLSMKTHHGDLPERSELPRSGGSA